jgi:hypothetical protein
MDDNKTGTAAENQAPADTSFDEGGAKYSAQASDKTSQQAAAAPGNPADHEHHGFLGAWKERLDQKLVEIFQGAKDRAIDKAEDMGIIARLRLEEWLDKTEMDDKARAQWQKLKGDGHQFTAQVENRITHLIANGQIVWANWKKKIDEAREEVQQTVEQTVEQAEDKLEAKG